jgi:hypothetical protein
VSVCVCLCVRRGWGGGHETDLDVTRRAAEASVCVVESAPVSLFSEQTTIVGLVHVISVLLNS